MDQAQVILPVAASLASQAPSPQPVPGVSLQVGVREDQVVVDFGRSLSGLGLSVQQARDFADLLRRKANQIARPRGPREGRARRRHR